MGSVKGRALTFGVYKPDHYLNEPYKFEYDQIWNIEVIWVLISELTKTHITALERYAKSDILYILETQPSSDSAELWWF